MGNPDSQQRELTAHIQDQPLVPLLTDPFAASLTAPLTRGVCLLCRRIPAAEHGGAGASGGRAGQRRVGGGAAAGRCAAGGAAAGGHARRLPVGCHISAAAAGRAGG